MYFAALICVDEVCHSLDLWVTLVPMTERKFRFKIEGSNSRFGLLAVEGVYFAACQHIGENKVLENLDALR